MPAAPVPVRPSLRATPDAPGLSARRDLRRDRRGRDSQDRDLRDTKMATPDTTVAPSGKQLSAEESALKGINANYKEKFGFHDPETGYAYKAPKGLSRELVESISEYKNEPQWMREFRLKALEHYESRPMPMWGANLAQIDFADIHYFVRA